MLTRASMRTEPIQICPPFKDFSTYIALGFSQARKVNLRMMRPHSSTRSKFFVTGRTEHIFFHPMIIIKLLGTPCQPLKTLCFPEHKEEHENSKKTNHCHKPANRRSFCRRRRGTHRTLADDHTGVGELTVTLKLGFDTKYMGRPTFSAEFKNWCISKKNLRLPTAKIVWKVPERTE
jgi:hypothetical protein